MARLLAASLDSVACHRTLTLTEFCGVLNCGAQVETEREQALLQLATQARARPRPRHLVLDRASRASHSDIIIIPRRRERQQRGKAPPRHQ